MGILIHEGRRWWTFPIRNKRGQTVALKFHRADAADEGSKSRWEPYGVGRDHAWPVNLSHPGPVWVCPGELKGLAVIAAGRNAIGITSGEGNIKKPTDLPADALTLLRRRTAVIAGDDDETGHAWTDQVHRQLIEAGIDAHVVDLGLEKSAGLKDIGDYIVRQRIEDAREAEAVAESLDEAYRHADPWCRTQLKDLWGLTAVWQPVKYIRTGLTALDATLGGGFRTRGAHLFAAKTGQAKSQTAVNIAINAARSGFSVGYLSLELSADEIVQLTAAILADIPRSALARGQLSGEYGEHFLRAKRLYETLPLCVLDDAHWPDGLDRNGLDRIIAEGKRRFGWELVVLDYLGLLASPTLNEDQFTADIRNSTVLRKLARKYDIALVVVVALRKSQQLQHAKPENITLDDIAGAARLAYDAQTVLIVSREVGDAETGLVKLHPRKIRFAPCHEDQAIQLRWFPATGRIVDLE